MIEQTEIIGPTDEHRWAIRLTILAFVLAFGSGLVTSFQKSNIALKQQKIAYCAEQDRLLISSRLFYDESLGFCRFVHIPDVRLSE